MTGLSEWAAEQQVFAAWLEAAGVVLAALLAVAIWALQAWRAKRRDDRRERRYLEAVRALGAEGRRLAYEGMQAAAGGEVPTATGLELAAQARQIEAALLDLPLEQAPDAAVVAPLLQLRRHAGEIELLATGGTSTVAPADAFALLQRAFDHELARLDGIERQQSGALPLSLRHRAEVGMPTTTIDRYSVFRFNDDLYPEADGVDFEARVNNQTVLCMVPYADLDRLATAAGIPAGDHRAAFSYYRDPIQRAAEHLIREGAKAPVVIRHDDLPAQLQPARAPYQPSRADAVPTEMPRPTWAPGRA